MKNPPHSIFYYLDESYREMNSELKGKKYVIDRKAAKNGNFRYKKVPNVRPVKAHIAYKNTQDKVNLLIENFIDSLPDEYHIFSKEKLSRIFNIKQPQIHEALSYMNKGGKMDKPLYSSP